MISVADALKTMKNGQPFRCRVVAFDRRRQTGGQIEDYEAVLLDEETFLSMRPDRAMTALEKREQRLDHRKPNHSENWTRNIRVCQNGQPTSLIRKIHPPLLVEFNGQKVTP